MAGIRNGNGNEGKEGARIEWLVNAMLGVGKVEDGKGRNDVGHGYHVEGRCWFREAMTLGSSSSSAAARFGLPGKPIASPRIDLYHNGREH